MLIVAHGNSLRALVKYLDNIPDEEIVGLNIPNPGIPLVYELDDDLKPIKHYYLGDPAEIAKAQQAVANQGKSKVISFNIKEATLKVASSISSVSYSFLKFIRAFSAAKLTDS